MGQFGPIIFAAIVFAIGVVSVPLAIRLASRSRNPRPYAALFVTVVVGLLAGVSISHVAA